MSCIVHRIARIIEFLNELELLGELRLNRIGHRTSVAFLTSDLRKVSKVIDAANPLGQPFARISIPQSEQIKGAGLCDGEAALNPLWFSLSAPQVSGDASAWSAFRLKLRPASSSVELNRVQLRISQSRRLLGWW